MRCTELVRGAVRLLTVAGLIPAGRVILDAQPAATRPSFRVSVNLVQVDAIVTDSKGKRVSDLRSDDFEVFEDGKRQIIANCEWVDLKTPRSSASLAGAVVAVEKEAIRRSIVLMIDDSGSWAEQDVFPVITAARRFVNEQVAPGDLVSVTASRGGMGFYQQFTSDPRQLNAAIDHISRRPGFGMWTVPLPEVPNEKGEFVPIRLVPGEPGYGFRGGEPADPIGHLIWAIQGFRNIPGRKAVVLFSHHFAAPPAVVDLANRAGVAIYVIDAHGMDLGNPVVPSNAPYRKLARDTGGLFLLSAPGANLAEDLRKVVDDLSGYYLIGYRAERSEQEISGRPAHHDLEVKVLRKGLLVRARTSSVDFPKAAPATSAPLTTAERLRRVLDSPFNAGTIRLRLDTTYSASAPDPKTRLRHPLLRAVVAADGKDVRFTEGQQGRKKAAYSVLIAVFRQDGAAVTSRERTFTFDLTTDEAAGLSESGLRAVMNVELPNAGPYQVRAAVRDGNTEGTGSAYAFVDVPDFNAGQIVLSGVQLSTPDTSKDGVGGWDAYTAGIAVHFECQVFGFRIGTHPPRSPQVDMRVRLFAGGSDKPVIDSGVIPVPASTLTENYLAGALRIGSNFEPGDYTMQLLAYDRLAAPRKQVAAQWTHLTVTSPGGR